MTGGLAAPRAALALLPGFSRPPIKICGITTAADAALVVEAGADLVGVNFVPSSPRRVGEAEARSVLRALAGRARSVGLVASSDATEIEALRAELGLDFVQVYGDLDAAGWARVEAFAWPVARLGDDADAARASRLPGALVVVDARVVGALGGTGQRAPVELARSVASVRPVLLAGGLAPANVEAAVRGVRPAGVDVSSGVEVVVGAKDRELVARFVEQARGALDALVRP